MCRSGGGALSGKDPTQGGPARRVHGAEDRLRYRAGTVGASCEVQLAYAIGMAAPISFPAQKLAPTASRRTILRHINSRYDLTPGGIIEGLGLKLAWITTASPPTWALLEGGPAVEA